MRTSRTIGKVAAVLILVSSAILARAQDSGDPWKFPDFSAIQSHGAGAATVADESVLVGHQRAG